RRCSTPPSSIVFRKRSGIRSCSSIDALTAPPGVRIAFTSTSSAYSGVEASRRSRAATRAAGALTRTLTLEAAAEAKQHLQRARHVVQPVAEVDAQVGDRHAKADACQPRRVDA